MKPTLIHKSREFLVIHKPSGMLVHRLGNTALREEPETIADWLAKQYPETKKVGDDPALRPGIVHRLDKDTSGILLVARTQEFFEYAKDLFQTRAIKKTYLALARGHVERERNIIDRPLGIKAHTTSRSVHSKKMAKDAVTEYHVLERAIRANDSEENPGFKSTLLQVLPHTGRTHQIRVHLTAIGHPVLGDPLYGPKQKLIWIPRLMLHAYKLAFTLPSGEAVSFEKFPDADFLSGMREAGCEYSIIKK